MERKVRHVKEQGQRRVGLVSGRAGKKEVVCMRARCGAGEAPLNNCRCA